MRRRILHISAGLPDSHPGGLSGYVNDLLDGLSARDYALHYLDTGCFDPRYGRLTLRKTEKQFVHWSICNSRFPSELSRGTCEPLWQITPQPGYLKWMAAVLQEAQPDLIHVHELIGLPIAVVAWLIDRGYPLLFTVQDYFSLCPIAKLTLPDGSDCSLAERRLVCHRCCREATPWVARHGQARVNYMTRIMGWPPWFMGVPRRAIAACGRLSSLLLSRPEYFRRRRRYFIEVLKRIPAILCLSENVAAIMRRYIGDRLSLRVEYLSRRSFRARPPEQATPSADGKMNILALNVRGAAKGTELLKREVGLLERRNRQDIRFVLRSCHRIESPLVDCGASYQPEDLDRICSSAQVGLVPSVWREPYGYVGIEMLTRGLPLIASARGGIPEYVRDGVDGLLFDPGLPGALAKLCERLCDQPHLLASLQKGAQEAWKRFATFDEHLDRMETIYEELIRKTHGCPLH